MRGRVGGGARKSHKEKKLPCLNNNAVLGVRDVPVGRNLHAL